MNLSGLFHVLESKLALYYGTELMLDNDLEFYGTPTIADIAYEWAPTHAEWNRLQHALHGNGKGGKGKVKRIETVRMGAINVNGVHVIERAGTMECEGTARECRRGGGEGGVVRDARKDTTEKLDELINMIKGGKMAIMVWADTHMTQAEMKDVGDIVRQRGLEMGGTAAVTTEAGIKLTAGVTVVWDPSEIELAARGRMRRSRKWSRGGSWRWTCAPCGMGGSGGKSAHTCQCGGGEGGTHGHLGM